MGLSRITLSLPFILWIVPCIYGQEVDVRKLNYEKLNSVLFALKEYGKNNRPPPSQTPDTTKQYVCTTVLSETEIEKFDRFTPNQIQNNRIRAQYNEVDENGNPVHGEKIILTKYLDELIDQMAADNSDGTHPIVILYSFNIPCSIPEHKCAERLRKDKARQNYTLIVGFTNFFGYTDKKKITNRINSSRSLEEGNITTYYMRTLRKAVYYLPPRNKRKGSIVLTKASIQAEATDCFQSLVYECLIKQPLAFCCTTDVDAINMNDTSKILSFSINSMIYSCIDKVPNNQVIDTQFINCIKQWITSNIGDDCRTCLSTERIGEDWSKFFIGQCAEQAEKLSKRLSGTEEPIVNVLDQPVWKLGRPIERDPNVITQFARPIQCTSPTLDPTSFCTKSKRNPDQRTRELPPAKRPAILFTKNLKIDFTLKRKLKSLRLFTKNLK